MPLWWVIADYINPIARTNRRYGYIHAAEKHTPGVGTPMIAGGPHSWAEVRYEEVANGWATAPMPPNMTGFMS